MIIGAVRQELLSGVREPVQFKRLREILAAFPDEPTIPQDYELAAEFYNSCRAKGIQGSLTDLLICAVARRKAFDILTLDQDFLRYASVIPIKLHPLSRK